jgi:hypothetical protein
MQAAVTSRTRGAVDRCELLFSHEPYGSAHRSPAPGETFIVSGWLGHVANVQRIEVVVDSGYRQIAVSGFARPEHAGALPDTAPRDCGFRAFLRADSLGVGEHDLVVECVTASGERFRGDGPPFRLSIREMRGGGRPRADGSIDEVRIGRRKIERKDAPIDAPVGSVVVLSGWIVDGETRAAGVCAFMLVDGRPVPTVYGFERPDVAEAHGSAALRSGFVGRIDVDSLAGDRVAVRVAVLSRQGTSLAELSGQDIHIHRAARTN